MVVDYKYKTGFNDAIPITPEPQEPTKQQYDHDVVTAFGFRKGLRLEDVDKGNIEQGHAIPAGHSCEHESPLART